MAPWRQRSARCAGAATVVALAALALAGPARAGAGDGASGAAEAGAALRFSDARLKENVVSADLSALLDAVLKVELKEFDFKYEQFYNKVFGARTLGVIAQEAVKVMPRAVGVVEKRAVGKPGDATPTMLENVHVFNPEYVYMANVGATKQLHKLHGELEARVQTLGRSMDAAAHEFEVARRAEEDVARLKLRQLELETLAKEAHERSAATAKVERAVELLERDGEAQKSQNQGLAARVERLSDMLSAEVTSQAALHRDSATEAARAAAQAELLARAVDDLRTELRARGEAQTKAQAEVEARAKELTLGLKEQTGAQAAALKEQTAAQAAALKEQAATQSRELAVALKEQAAAQARELALALKEQAAEWRREAEALRQAVAALQAAERSLAADVEALRAEVRKQAGEEIVERRRVAEAEVALERARAEAERARAEQEHARMELAHAHARENEERLANASVARVAAEEAARGARELELLRKREESALREEAARFENQRQLQGAAQEAELQALRIKEALAKETAAASAEAETRRERENKDVRLEMVRAQAEEARKATAALVRGVAAEVAGLASLATQSPAQLAGAVGLLVALAAGVFAAKEAAALWRAVWQKRLGQPALVRETSAAGGGRRAAGRVAAALLEPARALAGRALEAVRPPTPEERERRLKSAAQQRLAQASFLHFMKDVVLPAGKAEQIGRIARATRAAHANGTPLRHVLFYGPPGTGKSMVCRYLSQWCQLDYAIMSGADVAPLKDRAVTEIHALFAWANSTERGVLLFIDEADAFLASRDGGAVSESLRNALTALLFHTGAASGKVMLVLATNRPGDMDRAVLDRVDESVQFDLPSERERLLMLQQYFALSVQPFVAPDSSAEMAAAALPDAARKTAGFSGREISKLMTSVQAHVYGHEESAAAASSGAMSPKKQPARKPVLQRDLFKQVVDHAVAEHAKMVTMQHTADYSALFKAPSTPRKEE
jgi:ATPase family AAA domain-containing protein 3A/B